MSKGLFITAIGTDIGKTYVTGLLVNAYAMQASTQAITKQR